MSILYLRPHEARAMAQGRLGRITRVIVPQPLPFCSHVEPFRGEGGGWIAGDNTGRIIKAPCRSGDVLDAKETWARRKWSEGRFYYKATPELGWVNMDESGWRSPVCMPSDAVRFHPVVARLVVQRAQEVSHEDVLLEGYAECAGYDSVKSPCDCIIAEWAEQFDADNARRGYTWAMNPWCWGIYLERGQ